jgi:hypothetical protein
MKKMWLTILVVSFGRLAGFSIGPEKEDRNDQATLVEKLDQGISVRIDSVKGKLIVVGLDFRTAFGRITNADLAILPKFPHLRDLSLALTYTNDNAMTTVAQLPSLERLDVSFTDVTAKGLATISKLKKLRILIICECRITGADIKLLRPFRSLEEVDAGGIRATKADLRELQALTKLRVLNLHLNSSPTNRQ